MKNILQQIFSKGVKTDGPIQITPSAYFFDRIRGDATEEQKFRLNAVDHIGYLERAQRKDLAKLEAVKLVDHLKMCFDI